MPTLSEADEAYARYVGEIATLTSLTPDEVDDFLTCSPAEQATIAEGYRAMSWTRAPDTLAEVLNILSVIGSLASAVAGVAGAAGAIAALKSL